MNDSLNKKRLLIVGGGSAVAYSSLLIGLNQAWYAGYPKSKFHFINDNQSWLQIDKLGHAYSSYAYGIAGIELMKWTGIPRKKAIWIGGLAGTIFQTPIEVLDGFSAEWGASGGDLIANSVGSLLVIFQELAWNQQKLQFKFSYWPSKYAAMRPTMLGENAISSILKDYNAQTYWISVNPYSFGLKQGWPHWLAISVGYGANGMLGATENRWTTNQGMEFDYTHIHRTRELYFSLDLDLQQFKVKNPFWSKALKTVNLIKIPAPAISVNSRNQWQFYPIKF